MKRYCLIPIGDSPAEHQAFARVIVPQKCATDQTTSIKLQIIIGGVEQGCILSQTLFNI